MGLRKFYAEKQKQLAKHGIDLPDLKQEHLDTMAATMDEDSITDQIISSLESPTGNIGDGELCPHCVGVTQCSYCPFQREHGYCGDEGSWYNRATVKARGALVDLLNTAALLDALQDLDDEEEVN